MGWMVTVMPTPGLNISEWASPGPTHQFWITTQTLYQFGSFWCLQNIYECHSYAGFSFVDIIVQQLGDSEVIQKYTKIIKAVAVISPWRTNMLTLQGKITVTIFITVALLLCYSYKTARWQLGNSSLIKLHNICATVVQLLCNFCATASLLEESFRERSLLQVYIKIWLFLILCH